MQQSETTGGECKIARIASLVCEACGAGYVQAAADATPQTAARACSVLQCAGDNDVTCGCAVNQAVVNVDNDNFLECAACPTGTTFPNGDTTPQTTVRACTPNVCTGTPPITFGSTNIVACTAPCTPKANGATISTGDNVLAFVKCNGPSYVRTPSELTSGAGSTPAPAVAVCAATGANGVTLTGMTCRATCAALAFGANVLGGDTNGCTNGQRLLAGSGSATTCTLKCAPGYTASGPATFTCADAASANTVPVSTFTCAENKCVANSGTRTGYKCANANPNTACSAGPVTSATAVSAFGAVTCATGYGAGPKATAAAAANNPAALTCAGNPATNPVVANFAFTGCHNRKCSAINDAGNPFAEANCAAGYKLKASLDVFCETTTCASTDCCVNIDECTEFNAPSTPARTDASGVAGAVRMHGCHANAVCKDADPGNATDNGNAAPTLDLSGSAIANAPPAGSNGGSVGTTASTHVCTCKYGHFGTGQICTPCTAVANSQSVTCTTATNSRAVCKTGAIKVPAPSLTTADVCRLECPFVDLAAMIDSLQPTCPALTAVADAETSKTACEKVPGCYYGIAKCSDPTKRTQAACGAPATWAAQSCGVLYTTCKTLTASSAACTTNGPRAWGAATLAADDGTPDTDTSGDGTIGTVTTSACKFTAAAAGGDAWDDANRCDIAPMHIKAPGSAGSATYADARTPTVRCQALLDTNWAHDLRGSCDATAKCSLHDSASSAADGLVANVKKVYANPAASPPNLAATTSAALSGTAAGPSNHYFTSHLGTDAKTEWKTCRSIRDAVNAAPTCSSGAGR